MEHTVEVFGILFVKKKKRLIHLATVENEVEATKTAIEFLRGRMRLNMPAEVKAVQDEEVLFHWAVEESKPTVVTDDELTLMERGAKLR